MWSKVIRLAIFDMLRLFWWCILLAVLSNWFSFETTVLVGLATIITDIRKTNDK